MKKRGFTLVELLVVISIIALLLAILAPALSRVRQLAQRVVCGANLKGLGNACMVYAADNDDEYPVQGPQLVWDTFTAGWNNPLKRWEAGQSATVGASLYLLIREADVSPKQFVCRSGDEKAYDGENVLATTGEPGDLVEVWDFGMWERGNTTPGDGKGEEYGPKSCVSYSYQLPYRGMYGAYPVDAGSDASMAVMADKNPWFDPKLQYTDEVPAPGGSDTLNPDTYQSYVARIEFDDNMDGWDKWMVEVGNSQPHLREGQNVLYADVHVEFEKRADIGVMNDNIYTMNPAEGPGGVNNRRRGYLPDGEGIVGSGGPSFMNDNFLVNDDDRVNY